MSKNEFLRKLSRLLRRVRTQERRRAIAFYDEMIADAMEDGLSEQEAVERLGSVEAVAEKTIAEARESGKLKPEGRPLSTTLIIVGSPLWLALLIAVIAVIISIYIVVWSVIISLFAIVVSLGAGAVAGVFGFAALMTRNMAPAFALFGCGLVCAGLCLLSAPAVWLLTKKLAVGTAHLCVNIWHSCVDMFRREK